MAADPSALAEVPMFSLLDFEERSTLSELLGTCHFEKGDTLFSFGDPGECLYLVRSGRVEVFVESFQGDKILLAANEPGDIFGEISLLDGGPRTATAVAIETTECLSLDREKLQEFIARHPHAAIDLLTVMGRRLRATDELLRTHVTRNLNQEEEERLTFGERIADKVASFGGSWTFIISFGFVLLAWMSINLYMATHAFDPYPFILLNLVLSALASVQAPVIMMSQNRQAAKDRLKADLDYEINLKAELEIAQLHNKMDRLYEAQQAHFAMHEKRLSGIINANSAQSGS
jgi:uncharacterized membrane protein